MESKHKISLLFLTPAQRQNRAAMILAENLKRVHEKLGIVETQLTPAIGHKDGVSAFSVKEIMYVYGVNRSTAYRWKDFDVHPEEFPILDSTKKIRWTEQLDPQRTDKRWIRKPRNPLLKVISRARSAVQSALDKIELTDFGAYVNDDCIEAAADMVETARDIEFALEQYVHTVQSEDASETSHKAEKASHGCT